MPMFTVSHEETGSTVKVKNTLAGPIIISRSDGRSFMLRADNDAPFDRRWGVWEYLEEGDERRHDPVAHFPEKWDAIKKVATGRVPTERYA